MAAFKLDALKHGPGACDQGDFSVSTATVSPTDPPGSPRGGGWLHTLLIIWAALATIAAGFFATRNSTFNQTDSDVNGPVGVWHWFVGPDITIKEDGTAELETDHGRWAWTDKKRRGFQISWENKNVVDSLILSPDGRRVSGSNNRGTRVTGERID
jgi:hypothetical protein